MVLDTATQFIKVLFFINKRQKGRIIKFQLQCSPNLSPNNRNKCDFLLKMLSLVKEISNEGREL